MRQAERWEEFTNERGNEGVQRPGSVRKGNEFPFQKGTSVRSNPNVEPGETKHEPGRRLGEFPLRIMQKGRAQKRSCLGKRRRICMVRDEGVCRGTGGVRTIDVRVRLPQDARASAWHELNASPRSKETEFELGRMQGPCKQSRRGAGRSRRPTDGIARSRLAMGGSNVRLICAFGPSISDSADGNCVLRRPAKTSACCFVAFVRVKRRLSKSSSPSPTFSPSSSQETPPGFPRRHTPQHPTCETKSARVEGEI